MVTRQTAWETEAMLIDTIKADRLQAMKARDEVRKNLLGTLATAATRETKTPDDASVIRTLRSFLKSVDETIALLAAKGLPAEQQRLEKAVLEAYLPPSLSDAELQASIVEIVRALPDRSPKVMGQVMAALKAKHGDAFDARTAGALVRTALS